MVSETLSTLSNQSRATMASKRNVVCLENEGLVVFLLQKWEEMAAKDNFTERLGVTLSKAYTNLCDHKDPILDLKGASKVKGIGNWTLTLMKEYFYSNMDEYPLSQEVSEPRAKKGKGLGRYLPQKSFAPYAILIALYKGTQNEKEYMLKQELIDAAEASGLSRMAIGICHQAIKEQCISWTIWEPSQRMVFWVEFNEDIDIKRTSCEVKLSSKVSN